MAKTINKDGLVEALTLQEMFVDQPKYKVKEFVEDFFGIISEAVSQGDTVSIAKFGKFEPYTRLNGSIKPKFVAFKDFRDAVV